MQAEDGFKTIMHKNGQIQIQLNSKYFIKEDHDLYTVIEILVKKINEKNQKGKGKLPKELNLKYYCSVEFILGKHKMSDEKCTICLEDFEISKDLKMELAQSTDQDIYQLECSHRYHRECLINMIGDKTWAKCPVCSTIFGKMTGDQPEGTFKVQIDKNQTCPGHPKGTIIVNYNFGQGIRNGNNFPGTSRTGYLPDTAEGRYVCELLKQAFARKLVFTVGRSVTTGLDNQIVWNGIHHKTVLNGGAANFGYPDATYLKRIKEELALKGVVAIKKEFALKKVVPVKKELALKEVAPIRKVLRKKK